MRNFIIFALCAAFLSGCVTLNTRVTAKTTHAVIVGMEKSAKFGSCPGCSKDANMMNQILKKYTGDITVLNNGQATRSRVASALKAGLDSDLLIFFYSGHGGSQKANDPSEKDGMDEYLCLYDGSMLDNELWNIVSQKKKGRVFMIFDCCHAETMYKSVGFTMKSVIEDATNTVENVETDVSILSEPKSSGVNLLCWSGCPDNDYSYGDSNGGTFTLALYNSFKEKKTYDELWSDIQKKAREQNPRKTQIGHGFGGKVFK